MPQRHVAIFLDMTSSFGRGIMEGISRYCLTHEPWLFSGDPERIVAPVERIEHWDGDGIIAQVWQESMLGLLNDSGRPFVNVSHHLPLDLPASVLADSTRIGAMAADHLLQRGFRTFAYCGFARHAYSEHRRIGFSEALSDAGFECDCFEGPPPQAVPQGWAAAQATLGAWVASLPKPTGMMCCNDVRARHVAQVSLEAGVRIPEDLALIGADNDSLICQMSNPPLSSVDVSAEQIGYEAARLLDDMMAGKPPVTRPLLVPPTGVVTRRSSDVLAITDAVVADAVRFIHDHAHEPMGVEDVVAAVPVSRRVLERRFRAALKRTVGDEIDNARIMVVKRLLVHGDETMAVVSRRSGFHHVQQMNRLFKDMTGTTPSAYRRHYRLR